MVQSECQQCMDQICDMAHTRINMKENKCFIGSKKNELGFENAYLKMDTNIARIAMINSSTSSQLIFMWAACAFKNMTDKSNAKFDNKPVNMWDMVSIW